jgi:hypothetical protein
MADHPGDPGPDRGVGFLFRLGDGADGGVACPHAFAETSGDTRAGTVNTLIERKDRLIGALLIGNNLVNILASALATSVLLSIFGDSGVALATLTMTLLLVVFAEVLPKSWAISTPDRFAMFVAPVVKAVRPGRRTVVEPHQLDRAQDHVALRRHLRGGNLDAVSA